MENIIIKISKSTRKVDLSKSVIGNDGENLQENLIFEFDEFVNGTARLELKLPNETTSSYLMLTKVEESYQIPVKSVITKTGRLNLQLVVTEGTDDEEIPIFKSNQFYVIVNSSINAEIEQPEEYPQWIDVANAKLNEIDEAIQEVSNLNIDVNKEEHTTTITITKKDGTEESVQVLDGQDGLDGADGITPTIGDNGDWYIGETDTGKPSRGETGPVGPTGQDGHTPIKGVDYFTPEDIASLNIPSKTSQLQNDSGYVKSSELSSVATSGSYNDLSNKPDLSNYITKDVNDLTNYYKKTETYTQSEIDTKLTAVYKYKGTVSTYADLPSTGLTIGDVYNVETDGSNYAWTGTEWDKLGGTIDLTDYYTKTETNTLLSGKQNTIDSSHKLSADLVDDTNSTNKFVSSSDITNWNSKLDSSKVKNASSTTAGDVYDVRYINSLIGDISSAIDLINGESL